MFEGKTCEFCARNHRSEDCPSRIKCEHGTPIDGPETGHPKCWQCEVKPYRNERRDARPDNSGACDHCKGSGDVPNNAGWSKCRRCGGTGTSPASVVCPYCGATVGTGCYRHGAHMQGQADYFHKARIDVIARSTGLNVAIRKAIKSAETGREVTGNVVPMDDYRPHEVGPAECRACHHRHVQVIPVQRAPGGSECPRCGEYEVFFNMRGENGR